jgi:hypothetical protein
MMETNDKAKLVIAVLCMTAWLILICMGKTEVAPFVGALRDILFGLGVYHSVKSRKGDS